MQTETIYIIGWLVYGIAGIAAGFIKGYQLGKRDSESKIQKTIDLWFDN